MKPMAVDSFRSAPEAPIPTAESTRARWRALPDLGELARWRWAVPAGLVVLTAISFVIRIQSLNFFYWADEGISVGIASHPLSQIPHLLRQDGSPPLYYLLLHVWMQLFGRREVATHVLSLIPALIAVPVAYWAGASLFDRRTGWICAVLIALVPFLTEYAQETRMYSLMALLSLIVAAAFVRAFIHRRRRYLPVFSVALTAAMYTHNWALFLGASTFVAFVVCVRMAPPDERRGLVRDGVFGFGLVIVLFAPWLPTLLYQARHTGAPWALKPDVWSLTQGLYFIVGGRGAAVGLLLGAGMGLATIWQASKFRGAEWLGITSMLLLGLLTLVIAWVEAKLNPSWAPRYEAVIVGPLAILFAAGLARAGRLGLVALVLVCGFWILGPLPTSRDSKSNVASAAAVVRNHLGSDPLVISTQPEEVPDIAYYLPDVTHFATPLGVVSDPRVDDWINVMHRFRRSSVSSTLAPILRALHPGQRVALVIPTRLPNTPLYLKLINQSSVRWLHYMRHDPRLRLLLATSPHHGASGLPVEIYLFAVR